MKAMTVNLKNFHFPFSQIKEEAAKNWRLILLYAVFLCGCLSGAMLYSNTGETVSSTAQTILEKLLEGSFPQNLRIIMIAGLIPLLLNLLCSFSALGMPIIFLCPAVCGMFVSAFISHLYCVYRVDGVVFSLILLLPAAVIFLVMMLIECNEGLILSGIIATNIFSAHKEGRGELRDYFIRFAVAAVVCCAIIAVQAACITYFGKALLF